MERKFSLPNKEKDLMEVVKKELFTAVVGDVLDKLGYQHQFLGPRFKPLSSDMVVFGKAMPVLEMDVFVETIEDSHNPILSKPFGLMFEALDDLRDGEVYICTGSSPTYALWGELMSIRAKKLGAAGAIVNGYSRDTHGILDQNFPTFSLGRYAQDQAPRGKVVDYRVPIEIDNIRINNGDWIFGDLDGVLVIPADAFEETIQLALEKVRTESAVREALENGMSASAAFDKFGVM